MTAATIGVKVQLWTFTAKPTRISVLLSLSLALLVLAGCNSNIEETPAEQATGESPDGDSEEVADESSPTEDDPFPLTITSCNGEQVTFEETPQRIVSIEEWTTELLLHLGLEDRIAATGYFNPEPPFPEELEDAADELNVITGDEGGAPGREAIVNANPDLVISVFKSSFSGDPLPTVDEWQEELDINAYQPVNEALGECRGDPTPVHDLSLLYEELRTLGELFQVEDRAEELITTMQTDIAELQELIADMPSYRMAHYGGLDTPFVSGGVSAPNALMSIIGGENVFEDIDVAYSEVSWEEFVERDPEAIWIMPSEIAEGAGSDIWERLRDDPRVSDVTAIQEERYAIAHHRIGGVATVRNVQAIRQLIEGIYDVEVE